MKGFYAIFEDLFETLALKSLKIAYKYSVLVGIAGLILHRG